MPEPDDKVGSETAFATDTTRALDTAGAEKIATRLAPSDDPAWVPAAGTVIAGRYRVERMVGEGGMGAVVAAVHLGLEERVALKFLHPKLAKDKESTTRFLREAQASARIRSEHVVRVLDVGDAEGGMPFIAMELLEGQDLESAVSDQPMPVELGVDCVLEAAEALAEAHAAGIIHRDIKPANLWLARRVDGSAHVKVLDFGISKQAKTDQRSTGGLTQTQSVFGSPTYMSPEQIRSSKHVDYKTDVWSLGIVLFELLSGKRPFEGETVSAMLAAIAADHPTPIRTYDPTIPEPIERAILRCLKKDSTERLSMKELAAALRPFASRTGQLAADRVAALEPAASVSGLDGGSLRASAAAPSSRRAKARSSDATAATDSQLGMTNPSASPPRGSRSRGAYFAAGLLLVVGATALTTALVVRPSPTTPAATAPPSIAPEPPAASTAPPAAASTPPAGSTPEPQASSSSAPSAPSSLSPRAPRGPAPPSARPVRAGAAKSEPPAPSPAATGVKPPAPAPAAPSGDLYSPGRF